MRRLAALLALALVVSSCGASARPEAAAPSATPAGVPGPSATTPTSTRSPAPSATASAAPRPIAGLLAEIDPARLDAHLRALTDVVSRDPRHPGHAKAAAYIKAQLAALGANITVESQRTVSQGIPLENIFATIDPLATPAGTGWVLVSAHYDSIANRTPGWRPSIDPAPGADDNATGTSCLLELARVLSGERARLRSRMVLAFFDGEELFFKGSGAYMATLERPYPYKAALNLDMVGFNPIADRLDLLWYTDASAGLRDRVIKANDTYNIGVSPLNAQYAADGNTIMDAAPFGIAGIPSIALCQRYGENDATFPGNHTFHTVNDTPDKITNARLWLKAAKLTLAVALELAQEPAP